VIDSGRVKENRRDEIKEAPALVDCWVSKASAQQRRGRAGRVRPGIAYHLFSSHTYDHVRTHQRIYIYLYVG
jgi:HrpA-like RNA helicase